MEELRERRVELKDERDEEGVEEEAEREIEELRERRSKLKDG